MSSTNRIRDQLRKWVPWWLSDRKFSNGKTVGFRFLWSMIAAFDAYFDWILAALQAAWPGKGTPTALAMIGRSRGILRGQADTNATYAAKLRLWLDKWAAAGSQRQLAIELHEYLGNSPKVRVVTRGGKWITVNANGTIEETTAAWNWDGTSHPARSTYWSELWVIIYPTQWADAPGVYGDDLYVLGNGHGIGHQVSRIEYEAVRGLCSQWKSAHTKVRAVIWTSDAALFDPTDPGSLPNGAWGGWGTTGSGSRVASSRNLTTCRYWEM